MALEMPISVEVANHLRDSCRVLSHHALQRHETKGWHGNRPSLWRGVGGLAAILEFVHDRLANMEQP